MAGTAAQLNRDAEEAAERSLTIFPWAVGSIIARALRRPAALNLRADEVRAAIDAVNAGMPTPTRRQTVDQVIGLCSRLASTARTRARANGRRSDIHEHYAADLEAVRNALLKLAES